MKIPGGTETQDRTPPADGRSCRPVTLVISDLKGSTALTERLEPETLRAVLSQYFDEMGAIFECHGGTVAKIIGDAIVTVFDAVVDGPAAAQCAACATLEAQAALARLNDDFDAIWGVRLQNRTGVATGDLAATPGEGLAIDLGVLAGEAVGVAESLEANAPPMGILIDDATRRLLGAAATVEGRGPVTGKGGSVTINAWQLLSVQTPSAPAEARPVEVSRPCPWCAHTNGARTRRCASCATALTSGDRGRESRRTVTIVFADPRPVTSDGAPLGADATHAVMSRYVAVMRPIVERHGGTTEKFIGDALMAVFGLPVRHEDDAVRAVRAAAEMRAALVELNDGLQARFAVRLAGPIGVNTGTVVATGSREGQRLVTGDAVNVAARLEQAAGAGEVLLGGATQRLLGAAAEVEGVEPLTLRGKADPVPAFRLLRVAVMADTDHRSDVALIGRESERQSLRAGFGAAISTGHALRTTLLGEAGTGKSRLTSEFFADVAATARVLHGNCLAYGDGITFWPLLRLVHQAAGIDERDDAETARARITSIIPDDAELASRVRSIAGLDETPYVVAELVWAMRRLLEHLAEAQPLVVVFDDVHWAEPTLLQAVEDLAESIEAPVFIVCTARPTLLDDHRAFVEGATAVTLAPLTAQQGRAFLHSLLGDNDLDERQVGEIVDAAGGNPLFLEQLVSMLVDEGRLRRDDRRWRVIGRRRALALPASVEALVTARLDQVSDDERDVIEPASVIGLRFVQDAVEHLVPLPMRTTVTARLEDLGRRALLGPVDDEPSTFRFDHQVIRDATYNGMLKATRAALHEHYVRWADEINAARDRATEFEEICGYHLEQAHLFWRDLGPLDAHAIGIGIEAFRRLSSAGERAFARGDMHAASSLLSRAAELLPPGHEAKAQTQLLAGNALHEIGAFDEAGEAYEASAATADAVGDVAGARGARIERLRLDYLTGRAPDTAAVELEVRRALAALDVLGDPDALSRAWQLQLNVEIAACRWAGAQEAAERTIGFARDAGNELLEVRTMPLLAFLTQKGPMSVEQATAACRDLLNSVSFDRRSSGLVQLELATLSAMALDITRARRLYGETRAVLDELGWEMQAALVSLSSGPIELLADDPVRAERELRRDYDALTRMGERNFISLTATLLAEAVYRQHRFDEARHFADVGRDLADPYDLAVQILVRSVTGKLAVRAGELTEGVALCREAVRLIAPTDDPSGEGDALLDLAEALLIADEPGDARVAAGEAEAGYSAKGNVAGVRRATTFRNRIDSLSGDNGVRS